MYLPIGEHGVIGDLRTVALVGTDGTIDWYCCPRFDSPSIFAAKLRVLDTQPAFPPFEYCALFDKRRPQPLAIVIAELAASYSTFNGSIDPVGRIYPAPMQPSNRCLPGHHSPAPGGECFSGNRNFICDIIRQGFQNAEALDTVRDCRCA